MSKDDNQPFSNDYDTLFHQQPVQRPQKPKKKPFSGAVSVWWAIGFSILIAGLPIGIFVHDTKEAVGGLYSTALAYHRGHEHHSHTTHYALKAAGLKRTGTVDASKPLAVTVTRHAVTFNKGLTINLLKSGHTDDSSEKNDPRAVLPSSKPYADHQIATFIDIKSDALFVPMITVFFYGNIIADWQDDDQHGQGMITAVPRQNIGAVQTGYIVDSPNTDLHRLVKYFIFPDGTGVAVAVEYNQGKYVGIPTHPTYADIQRYYAFHLNVLEHDLQYKLQQAPGGTQ